MIDPGHDLPIKQQAEVLGISRSTVYYEPRPVSEEDLWLMRRLDELHLNCPFAGSRMLRGLLWQQGLEVGRRHIKTLMERLGIEAICRKPNTSKPAPAHSIYPYLLPGAPPMTCPQAAGAPSFPQSHYGKGGRPDFQGRPPIRGGPVDSPATWRDRAGCGPLSVDGRQSVSQRPAGRRLLDSGRRWPSAFQLRPGCVCRRGRRRACS